MTQTELFNLLERSLKYTPIVYRQSLFSTNQNNFDNVFRLEYKQTDIPDDSLLFFIPSISSLEGSCKLLISVPKKRNENDTEYFYESQQFDIVVETNNGTTRPASKGDIIAFRMCFFRFRKSYNQAVLCNSPLYNDAVFSNAKITNCEFVNLPTIKDPTNQNVEYTLVSTKEFEALKLRVSKLENRIIYGTADPEEALADMPSGTIYIQHEEE